MGKFINTEMFIEDAVKVKERYYKDIRDGNTIEILREFHFVEGTDAFDLEKLALELTSKNKYNGKPVLTHGGNTELRTVDCSTILDKIVKELNEINKQ